MAKMLNRTNRHATCHYGYKCCDFDGRKAKQKRRSQRRREAQDWKRESR